MPSPLAVVDDQRRRQARVSAATQALIGQTWNRTVDVRRLDATYPVFERLARELIAAGRAENARYAGLAYLEHRIASGVAGKPEIIYAASVNAERVATSLRVTGPVAVKAAVASGTPIETAYAKARSSVGRAAYRITAEGGRRTIEATIRRDPAARGWARVSDGDPCAFCAMLVSRGAVFKDSSGLVSERGELYHDGCGCSLQPVYSASDPVTDLTSRLSDLWSESTKGLSGKDAANAFRRAYERG